MYDHSYNGRGRWTYHVRPATFILQYTGEPYLLVNKVYAGSTTVATTPSPTNPVILAPVRHCYTYTHARWVVYYLMIKYMHLMITLFAYIHSWSLIIPVILWLNLKFAGMVHDFILRVFTLKLEFEWDCNLLNFHCDCVYFWKRRC